MRGPLELFDMEATLCKVVLLGGRPGAASPYASARTVLPFAKGQPRDEVGKFRAGALSIAVGRQI